MFFLSRRLPAALLLMLLLAGCGQSVPNQVSHQKPEAVIKKGVLLNGQNVGGFRISDMSDRLGEYINTTFVPPRNASFGKKWEIKPEIPGRRLNVKKTLDALSKAKEGQKVDYIFDRVSPQVTAGRLKRKIRVIGQYTTDLLDRSDSRVNNIDIASGKIDYTVLMPGEEFSFNRIVGKRTAAKGYEEAPIIVRTPKGPKKKKAKGGGICQISTTIYNAVEKSGLKVTERHLHSKDVGYVPRGDDATVSYGGVDFRFVNTRSKPIMLRLLFNEKTLTVRILENTA